MRLSSQPLAVEITALPLTSTLTLTHCFVTGL